MIESAELHEPPKRLFRRRRRRSRDLPALVGGSVRVFQCNERFALAPENKTLSSDVVVKATMVAVVITKKQLIPAIAVLPSITPGRRVAVRASYSCQVLEPVRVLANGCWDIRPDLLRHLLNDPQVKMLGTREDVADNPDVQQTILARIVARGLFEPPDIPGMRVELVDMALVVHSDEGEHRDPLMTGGYDHDDLRDDGYGHRDDPGSDNDDSYPPDGDRS